MTETTENPKIEEVTPQEIENQSRLEQEVFVEPKREVTWRSFIKISGFTIVFISLALISMTIGLIMYYVSSRPMVQNAGFWIIFVGVAIFLLTIIFGFERVH
ncbi:MAG: hypothetical protein FK732_11525 [Asgard group archaeon]|nr:hypothetical protein [Asgard group archaeon]